MMTKIRNTIEELKCFYLSNDKSTFFLALVMCCNVLGFMPQIPQLIVYGLLMICAVNSLLKNTRYNMFWIFLLVYIPLCILIASPKSYFRSWERYVMFAILIMTISPMLYSDRLRTIRFNMLKIVIYTCVFIGVGSFFAKFLGINFMKSNFNVVGTFGGLTTHSMLLGPLSGIGAVYLCYKTIATQNKYYGIMTALCVMSVLFSASRSALISSLVACVVVIYKMAERKSKFVRYIFVVSIIFAATFPVWEQASSGIMEKQQRNIESGGQFSSRSSLWNARMEEFKEHPFFGVGFVAIDDTHSSSYSNSKTGVIEPGSSWLSILSMTGLLGAFFVFPILYQAFKIAWKSPNETSTILVGLLSLFYMHMIAEGYIFSAGSFLCFTLWLIVGCASDMKFADSANDNDLCI